MSNEATRSPTRCPFCQSDMVRVEDDWEECPKCRLRTRPYTPSSEESAETRAAFQHWRHLLLVVAELHKLGHEHARIVPWIEDTPGGGDWHCIIAPATMISPSHGARIDEHIDWWRGTCPPGEDFPYFLGRGWRGYQPTFDSTESLLRAYPKLAKQCLARDREYAEWYREMLQTTQPDGVVYACAYWDEDKTPPINRMRVLSPKGELDVLVSLPPAGKAWLRG